MSEAPARLPLPLTVRVGLPTPGGRLVAAAKRRRYPVLFSANAFARRYPSGHELAGSFRGFRLPDARQLDGLDAALDSAGFVAATRYREYPWSVEEYVKLAASYPWRWWASMDYCCEPEVAHDRPLRLLRMAATVSLYYQCRRTARERGLSDPMPVLQGWTAQEYLQSIDWLDLVEWPALVGVGSMCRRAVRGCDGILEIVEALDRALPPRVQLHLFGVKSEALAALANHPRVASTDSMAWDAQARRERPVGRDARFRIQCMERWAEKQCAQLTIHARGGGLQTTLRMLFDEPIRSDVEACVLEGLALQYTDLIEAQDISYLDAVWCAKRDAPTAIALVRQGRVSDEDLQALDDVFAGLANRVEELRPRAHALANHAGSLIMDCTEVPPPPLRIQVHAMISIPARTAREIANRYMRRYRGFSIERTEHARGYLMHGVMHTEGFIVVRDGCNVMPGAAWFQDAAAAIEAIDVLLETGHGPAFWTELARRSAAKDHALELATLLDEFLDLDDWTDDLIAPSSLIERAQQVSARIKRGERRDPGASRR